MSTYQENLLRRAEARRGKIEPPRELVLSPREQTIREVAEMIASINNWGVEYTIRQVRRIVGNDIDPFYAVEKLQYGYGGTAKPKESKYPQENRAQRRRARAIARKDKGDYLDD